MKLFNTNSKHKEPSEARDYLDEFFALIIDFLIRNKLENKPKGFEDKEIEGYEIANSIKFPKAYRLFLSLMAKSDLRIFDCQYFTISGLKDAQKVSKELLKQDNYSLEDDKFVFTQWQGYNFWLLGCGLKSMIVTVVKNELHGIEMILFFFGETSSFSDDSPVTRS